jgi:hypothetical protein
MSAWNLGFGFGAHSQGSVADLDQDGIYEITTGYNNGGSQSPMTVLKISSPPEHVGTLPFTGSGPPRMIDVVGDSHKEIIYYNAYSWDTFSLIPGFYVNAWGTQINDIDGDGLAEIFGTRNGQIMCYDLDKPAPEGINSFTAHFGYRRLSSDVTYEPCPGTWWYSWDEWEEAHGQTTPVTCWKCEDGESWSKQFPSDTICGEGVAQDYPYQQEPDDCSLPPEICYKCINGEVTQIQLEQGEGCPDGWETEIPECEGLNIPGFELIFLLFALIVVIWRKKK